MEPGRTEKKRAMKTTLLNENIEISYFDPFALFDSVKTEFLELFPLDNVHWKPESGSTRIVPSLPVTLYAEEGNSDVNGKSKYMIKNPFVKLIIVTCQSIDEYRSKVRPLLRDWLPDAAKLNETATDKTRPTPLENNELPSIPLILIYANSAVIESNLFSSTSIIEKAQKDFPNAEVLELRSVYKSPKAKQDFWDQLKHNIKNYLLITFQKRLNTLQIRLAKFTNNQQVKERLEIREQLLHIFLQFRLGEEGKIQLETIEKEINIPKKKQLEMANGVLEFPFSFKLPYLLSELIQDEKLTRFYCYKGYFIWRLRILSMNKLNNDTAFIKVYEITKQFLRHIQMLFPEDPNVIQFKYSVVESILKLLPQLEPSKYTSIQAEAKADLMFMKRDYWLNGVLATTKFNILYKHFNLDKDIPYKFDVAPNTFTNESQFYETFINYNKDLIDLYNQCDSKRQRIIDILSLEIGIVHYQRKDYKNAIMLFISCYEYYIQSKWNIIGLEILKIFVDSLVNCPNVTVLEFGGSSVPVGTILSNAYLNLLKLSDSEEDKKIWWEKFINVDRIETDETEAKLIYSSDGLLDVIVDNYVTLKGPNEYQINISLEEFNLPGIMLTDSMQLTLKKCDHDDEIVMFENTDISINKDNSTISMTTCNINYGKFKVDSLQISVGRTTFIKSFEQIEQIIYIEPIFNCDSIDIIIEQGRKLELGKNELHLKFINLNKTDNISDLSLNLSVEKDDESVNYPISFSSTDINEIEHELTLQDLPMDKINEGICIPYYLQGPVTAFFLKSELTFKRLDKTSGELKVHKEIKHVFIQCYLAISVSVEDIFKNEAFYFKFLLNSSMKEEPVMLHESSLESEAETQDKYDTIGKLNPEDPILLTSFSGESCINSYRLAVKGNGKFNKNDLFYLHIKYNTLKEQLDSLLTEAVLLQGDMEYLTKFEEWKLFWKSNVLPRLQFNYDKFTKERVLMVEEHTLDMNFIIKKLLNRVGMDKDIKAGIIQCLNKLNDSGHKLDMLDMKEYSKNIPQRELIVPVELPPFGPFYMVQFESQTTENKSTNKSTNNNNNNSEIYTVGKPIPFKITVTDISEQWEGEDKETTNHNSNEQEEPYICEIASSNDWLLHGKKRFALGQQDPMTLNLSLIPLKRGCLALPRVEILGQDELQTARTDQPNEFDTILVL